MKLKIIFVLLILPLLLPAQSTLHKYFIRFTDKNGTAFTLTNPYDYLSLKAITRRAMQNIQVDSTDLPVNSTYVDGVASLGANVLTRSKWFNGITIECDSAILMDVLNLPYVQNSSQVFRKSFNKDNKILYNGQPLNYNSQLRIMSLDYGFSLNQIQMINGDYLHDNGYTGEGMLIAILDAGFYSADVLSVFDSVRSLGNIEATWDFVSGDAMVYDDDMHGTSVFSTIAGNLPGMLVGTAPHASFLLLRSEDSGSENIVEEYNWNAAAEYADSAGADIITSSLGYTRFDDSTANHTYADMDGNHCPSSIAADMAVSKGMLVINSAGNSGADTWHYIGAPADGDSVLSVGAVDSSGNYVYFSSFGPSYDGDIKPNVMTKGFEATVADAFGGVSSANGTSFSCPILAGAAACLWQQFPQMTCMEIKEAIEKSAHLYLTPNDSMGFGIPDFRIAGIYLSASNGNVPENDHVIGVFPNPFYDNLQVSFYSTTAKNIVIELINSIGQVVSSSKEQSSNMNLNVFNINTSGSLHSGIYFVKISTEENTFVAKVVRR